MEDQIIMLCKNVVSDKKRQLHFQEALSKGFVSLQQIFQTASTASFAPISEQFGFEARACSALRFTHSQHRQDKYFWKSCSKKSNDVKLRIIYSSYKYRSNNTDLDLSSSSRYVQLFSAFNYIDSTFMMLRPHQCLYKIHI